MPDGLPALIVNGDLAVSGAFLVGTMRASEANQISIDDNVTISGTIAANNLSDNATFSFGSNLSIAVLTKGSIGLGNVDSTSDASKPLSTAATNALANKADKDTTYAKNDSEIQMGLRIDSTNAALSSQHATIATFGY